MAMAPHKIPNAQCRRPYDKVAFMLDDSGSVAQFANLIADAIKTALHTPRIEVFKGMEAHPAYDVRRKEYIIKGRGRLNIFEDSLRAFFKKRGRDFPPGSRIVFWGDLIGTNIRSIADVSRLLKNYRVTWLFPYDFQARVASDRSLFDDPYSKESVTDSYPDLPGLGTCIRDSVLVDEMGWEVIDHVNCNKSLTEAIKKLI